MTEHIGVYPGTFDPVTNGHLDIIRRGARLVDLLVIAVARNAGKGPLFTIDERVAILEAEIAALPPVDGYRIEVRPFDTLLMHFAESVGATRQEARDAELHALGERRRGGGHCREDSPIGPVPQAACT